MMVMMKSIVQIKTGYKLLQAEFLECEQAEWRGFRNVTEVIVSTRYSKNAKKFVIVWERCHNSAYDATFRPSQTIKQWQR